MTDTVDPKDPVAVLRAAAQEMEELRHDPRFVIDMGCTWRRVYNPPALFRVNLPGALARAHPRADWSQTIEPLDMFQQGGVSYYLAFFGINNNTLLKAHKQFDGKWRFHGQLSPQEVDELISHCRTVADWLEDQGKNKR